MRRNLMKSKPHPTRATLPEPWGIYPALAMKGGFDSLGRPIHTGSDDAAESMENVR